MLAQMDRGSMVPALRRLHALSPLDAGAARALSVAVERPRRFAARREILGEGVEITETLLIVEGWAARQRILVDGRRQLIDFLLPGDLIGACDFERPVALSAVVAITDVLACAVPSPASVPGLARAYALSRAHADAQLSAQITRIGRLNAQDRIADLLLELLERLEIVGLAVNGRVSLPLTQEVIADALGLTAVHVNRTLQALRRDGAIDLKGRDLIVHQPAALRRSIGRTATRVTVA